MTPHSAFAAYRLPAAAGSESYSLQSPRALRLWLPLCAFAVLLFLAGCGRYSDNSTANWQLSTEGERLYYLLMQLEASTSGDEEAFNEASKKLLELDPDEFTFLNLAEDALQSHQFESARITARKGLAVFPKSLPLALIISDSYLQQERPGDAASVLQDFVQKNPDNREALQELARTYLLGNRHAELDKILRVIPAVKMTPYLRYIKARSLLNRHRPKEAEKELRRVVKAEPEMTEAWVNLAIAVQSQGRYAESYPLYQKALALAPDNLGTRLRLIDAQIRGKRPELAAKNVYAVPMPTFQMEAAILFVEAKYYKTARTILAHVKKMPGAPEEVHLYLAAIAIEHFRNPAEALVELSQIPPESPLAERALRWRLQLLEEAGRTHDAVPIAREFATRNPGSPIFQIVYAQVTAVTGNTVASVAILREAQKKWPGNSDVAFYLASFLDAVKDKEEALHLMEFVLTQQPRNALALNYVGYTLADEGRDLDKALDLLQRAVTEEPEDPHITDSLAWVLYRQGKYEEAWEAIGKSIRLGGDHPVIWEHYGDIATRIGKTNEAHKGYTNALGRNPENPDAIRAKMKELQ